jgi:ParB family chromosome partitioning protein
MITMIPRSKLEPHPDNPRKNLGDLTELAASIERSGLLQNLTVVPHPDKPGMYRIIIGHRRFAASEIAGLDELPCSIEEMDMPTQIATMLAENLQRNDLTIADQVGGVQMMLDLGESVKAISTKTGMSETSVRKRVSIASLPKKEMHLAADKGATLLDLLEVTTLEDPEAQADVLKNFGTNNFSWAVRTAKENEEKKKFLAEIMPQIHAKYPKIADVPESERYSGRWTDIWRVSMRDEERKPVPDPEPGEKYRLWQYGFGISIYKENKSYVKQKAKEKDYNAWLRDRKEAAVALNTEAFELRSSFVRSFRLKDKTAMARFHEMLMEHVVEWKSFITGIGFYRSGWDTSVLRRMLAIPYEEDRDKEETMKHELTRRGISWSSFLLAWALCGGIAGSVKPEDGWCNTYNGARKICEELDTQYSILTSCGYLMSDFEKSLQDGSHEFFQAKREGDDE